MNTSNEEPEANGNMENHKQQSGGCGAGCACHGAGGAGKAKGIICMLVLVVAAVLVVHAVTKTNAASAKTPASGFAVPAGDAATPSAAGTAGKTPATAATPAGKAFVGVPISTLAEVNIVAIGSDAVFVYLPGNEANSGEPPAKAIRAAMRTIGAKGVKCALFTLKPGSPDYAKLGQETVVPGVLAMVKGKGKNAVSGEITETKLVQGYVAASSGGACCSPGECE